MFKTLFQNQTEPVKPLESTTVARLSNELAHLAQCRRSRSWTIPLDVLNGDRSIEIGPGRSYEHVSKDEFAPYARYEEIRLVIKKDDYGDPVPQILTTIRKGFKEPEFPELSIVLLNDVYETLNCPPTYWSEEFRVTVPVGIEIIVPVKYTLAVAKYSGLVYQPVVQSRVFDPRLPGDYRTVHEGGTFLATMRTAEELKAIEEERLSRRAAAHGISLVMREKS
jgi:hypothetical protein